LKVRGDYKPKNYEYEQLHNGIAVIRFFENVKKFHEKGKDGQPDSTGYEYDRYTITRRHSAHLQANIADNTDKWLEFVKGEAVNTLAAEIRTRRDSLLDRTDKTQIPDAPLSDDSRAAFRAYRQALRDIPEQPGFPFEVEWPAEPETKK
jgi:hypothetical protein